MSNFLRPPRVSPDKVYEIAWQSFKRRQVAALFCRLLNGLEEGATTLLVLTTLLVMIHPGINKNLTGRYLAIEWLHYADSDTGLSETVNTEVQEYSNTDTPDNAAATRMINAAKGWINKEFKPGVAAQCSVFIHQVASEAGVDLRCTSGPIDGQFPVGPSYANCFFGADVGTIIKDRTQLRQGDLVAFGGTYGGFPKTVITHVGIYDKDGYIIDRSTMSAPVRHRSMDVFEGPGSGFLYGVRPHAYNEARVAVATTKD